LKNNFSRSKVNSIIAKYRELEQLSQEAGLSFDQSINLILLLTLNERWNETRDYRSKFLSTFKTINDKQYKIIETAVNIPFKLRSEPYCNIYESLQVFAGSNSLETSQIVKSFVQVYEAKQLYFLSQMYKTMAELDLLSLLNNPKEDVVTELYKKYGITKEKEFVSFENFTLSKIGISSEEIILSESFDFQGNLEYLDKSTTDLENIAKSNPFFYNFGK